MNSVVVRPWDEEDAYALHRLSMHPYYQKKRILQYLYQDTFLHEISTIHFYQQADPTRFLFRAIVYQNKVCGYLQAEKRQHTSCELSYWLGVEYWNQGIMEDALACFCKEIFKKWNVLCIYARVEQMNIPSQHVLQKNKFQKEIIDHIHIYRKYR